MSALALGACQQLSSFAGSGTVAGRETGTAGPSAGATATRCGAPTRAVHQVVSALTALGAKSIETLSVEEARRQPSPADAARRVLRERGQSTAPRPVPQVRDISVPTPAGPIPIISVELDPLRSEGETLANRLREAGVPVERRVYEGTTHEFFGMAPVVADAQAAQDFVGDRLRAALDTRPGRVAAR